MTDNAEQVQRAIAEFGRLAAYTPADRASFDCDDLVQTRVSRQARRAGEAAVPLAAHLREAYPGLPWDELGAWAALPPHPEDDAGREAVWRAATTAPAVLAALANWDGRGPV